MYVCGVCEKIFEKSRHLRLHYARNHTERSQWKSKCSICGKVYADDEILKRHSKTHNRIVTKVACPVEECRKLFVRKSFLDKHVSSAHPHISQTAEKSLSDSEATLSKKIYHCKHDGCEASFSKHNLLTQHSYIHTKILPFKCSQCEKRFLSMGHKNRHEKVHKGYPCKVCGDVMVTWSALLTHTAKIHRKEYKCESCNKVFHTPSRLKNHMEVHSITRETFQCSQCSRTFTRKHGLKVHMKVQHSCERPYKCMIENCDKSYAHCHSLKNHIKKFHDNNNPPTVKKKCSRKIDVASRILGVNSKVVERMKNIG